MKRGTDMTVSGGQTGRGPGSEDTFLVVRVSDRDVAKVRHALHHAGPMIQDAVFRRRGSIHNHGVDLYGSLLVGMDVLFERAAGFKQTQRGTVARCRGCGLSVAWNGSRWVDDQGQADTAGFCSASTDPDPVHEPGQYNREMRP